MAATIALSVITLPVIPDILARLPDVLVPVFETILSAVLEFVAPLTFPIFVMEFVAMAIPPPIVPPANGNHGPVEAEIPESLITLSETNDAKLFNVPVDVFETTSFVKRELTVPFNDPNKYL